MKRLVLYVTAEQLRTILPVVINDCVDFTVSDLDHVFDRHDKLPVTTTRSYNPKDLEIKDGVVVEKTITPTELSPEDKAARDENTANGKRRMQKYDAKGRKPWQVVVDAFDESRRAVMRRTELQQCLVASGFGAGTVTSAISQAIANGHLRALNQHRYTVNNTNGKRLVSLSELDVLKGS